MPEWARQSNSSRNWQREARRVPGSSWSAERVLYLIWKDPWMARLPIPTLGERWRVVG